MNLSNKTLIGLGVSLIAYSCGNNEQAPVVEEQKDVVVAFDMSNIDSTFSPCEDFEQFAVGNWLKNNPVPDSESRWGSFSVVHDANEIKLREIVQNASKAKGEKGSALQQVGDFYTSALDSNKVNELGITPIQPMLDKIEAVSNAQELVETMAETRKYGSGSLFGYYVYIDSKKSDEYITYLSQGGLGLPDKSYYTPSDERGENILEEYKKHVKALFVLKGQTEEDAQKSSEMVLSVENLLAEKSMDRVERRDPEKTYNKMTIEELQTLVPAIDWNSFFKKAEIENINEIVVGQPEFMKLYNTAFDKIPLENWKTYMKFHLINDFADDLSIDFEKQVFSFYSTVLRGTSEMKPRWKRALSKANGSVGEQIGKLFVEKHFPEESKQKVLDLIGNINKVFKERVQKLDWMSDSTKTKALEKLSKFTYKIGYPDKWEDYSSVDINASTLLQNVMNVNYFEYKKNVGRLGKPIDKDEWGMTPQTINAYYNPTMNEIVFPAAILQPPFFNPDADDAINYGGIGGVIGHEFSHGFDDQGCKFDGDGNLKNWWSDADLANFKERTNKLVNQFNKYEVVEGNFVNGELTLGENIADIAGITLAYYALEKAMEGKEDKMIDGYNFRQRFFLGWAQVWHTNATEQFLVNQVKTDPHSPTRFRTIGPLVNMSEFSDAFGCTGTDAKMIAPDSLRVKIW